MGRLPFAAIGPLLATLLAVGGGLWFRAARPAPPPTRAKGELLNAAGLRQDVRVLRRALEAAHPGLYWYTPKPVLDSLFTQTERGLTTPLSERAFFVRLLPLVAAVRCSHTSLAPSANPAGFGAARHRYLPLALAVQGGHVYIKDCYVPHPQNLLGAELTSVGGHPLGQVLARLLPLIPADGFNTTAKYHALSNGALVEGYSLIYPVADSIALRVQPLVGPATKLKLRTISVGELDAHRADARRPTTDFALTFDASGRVAVLTIRTFEPKGGATAFRTFLRHSFQEMARRGVPTLLVDVRGNHGGKNALVTDLFAYVALRPFLHIRRAKIKATALPYFSPPRRFAGLDTMDSPADAAGYYDVRFRYPGATLRQPVSQFGFRGRVLVLMDGGTMSAASEFVALARAQGRATLLGEEAGGGYAGATGGQYLNLVLPTSGLQVRIPSIRIWLAVGAAPPGHGALPDVKMEPTPAALVSHLDVSLNRALDLARTAAKGPPHQRPAN